jgi:hypothetical protein
MLVQLALIVFGLFAMVALVTDLGFVTLTRVQMQTAAEAAAIEGIRQRNRFSDGYSSDCVRRIAARDLVRWTFDDDFDISSDALQLGAGPFVDFAGGTTELDAMATMSIPAQPVYKPALQYNLESNAVHGDMVSGHYDAAQDHDELNTYARPDYTEVGGWGGGLPPCPASMPPPGSQPASGASGLLAVSNDSFLVRLRRTRNVDELDDIPDVSSSARPLPLLFSRGTAIHSDQGAGYNVRTEGLTVRGTAIAQAQPAMRVGLPSRAANVPGAWSFALTRSFASSFPNGAVVSIDASGQMTVAGALVGQFAADAPSIATVGNPLIEAPAGSCDPDAVPDELALVPVYDTVGLSSTDRVIGFVAARLTWPFCDPAAPAAPTQLTLGHGPHGVAFANATVSLIDGFSNTVPPSDVAAVITSARELAALGVSVLAPAVVR